MYPFVVENGRQVAGGGHPLTRRCVPPFYVVEPLVSFKTLALSCINMIVENSVVINRPVKDVFAYVSCIEKRPQWRSTVSEVTQTSEGPVDVGATYRLVDRFLGWSGEETLEISEYEPNRKLGYKVTGGPIPSIEMRYTFSEVEGGTRIDMLGQGELRGFSKLAHPLVRFMVRRMMDSDNAKLQRLLESRT